ncbi:MAG: hypothetical protein ACWA40_00030 [Planktomarina sp.]
MCGGGERDYYNGSYNEGCAFEPLRSMFHAHEPELVIISAINLSPLLVAVSAGLAVYYSAGRKRQISAAILGLTVIWMVLLQFITCSRAIGIDEQIIAVTLLGLTFVIFALCCASLWMGMPEGRAWVDRIGIFAGIYAVLAFLWEIYDETGSRVIIIMLLLALCGVIVKLLPTRISKPKDTL